MQQKKPSFSSLNRFGVPGAPAPFPIKKHLPETETLILGAWGCGAYGNDPHKITEKMNEVNLNFGGMFKNIVFSVPKGVNTQEFKEKIDTFEV